MSVAAPAQPAAEYAQYTGAVRWIILVAVMLGTVLEVLDVSIVNVAIPNMMGNLGATLDQISWVSTGYIIANVIVLPLTGWLSQHFGRRRYLTGSIVLFTIASFLCGMSKSLNALVAFRILQGVGGAALLSTAQATLMEVFPPRQIGTVQAIFSLGVVVAPTVGPTLGGWITDTWSWPWIFFVNIPLGIVAATLAATFLHDSKYHTGPAAKIDVVGILLLAVSIGSLQTVLEKGNREDWFESPLILWLTVASAIGFVLFLIWELRVDQPAVNLRVLKNRGFAAGTIVAMVLGFGLYGGVFVLPIFLQNFLHFSAMQSGLVFLPGGIATGIATMFAGRMVSRIPPRQMIAVGMVGFFCSMMMLHGLTGTTGTGDMFWPLVLRGFSLGFLFVPLTLASLMGLKGREIAYGTGLFNLSRQLGGSAGIAFLSTFLDHRMAFHRAMLVEHIHPYSPGVAIRLAGLQSALTARGTAPGVAKLQALNVLDLTVQAQASVLSFEDVFLVIGVLFLCALPLLLLFNKGVPRAMRRPAPE